MDLLAAEGGRCMVKARIRMRDLRIVLPGYLTLEVALRGFDLGTDVGNFLAFRADLAGACINNCCSHLDA